MSFTKSKYLKFAILIISICFLIGVVSACLPLNLSLPEVENNAIDNTAVTITQNADGFGEFKDGYSYVYTDKRKVDDYRAGTEEFDITTYKVNSSSSRGTQDNPFVISSVDEWNNFARRMDTGTNYGAGEYYVLANDIDFAGVPFYPIRFFNGTFYGMGHALQNVSITSWQYLSSAGAPTNIASTTYGFGIFCKITGATITDLLLQDFHFSGPSQTGIAYVNRTTLIGTLVGWSYGNDAILNCHIVGELDATNVSYTSYEMVGALIGARYSSSTATPLVVYRCSTELTAKTKNSGGFPLAGGIFGDVNRSTVYIYDCVVNFTMSNTSTNASVGGICGFNEANSKFIADNIVINMDVTNGGAGTLFLLSVSPSGTVTDCYTIGLSSGKSLNAASGSGGITYKNIHKVISTSSTVGTEACPASALTTHTSLSDLINSVEDGLGTYLPTQIWDEKKVSDLTTYWDASYAGDVTILDYSPVRNFLMAFIDFRNVINGGKDIENDVEAVDIDDGVGYLTGAALPTLDSDPDEFGAFITYLNGKATTMHKFVGWTDDPSGDGDIFTEVPGGVIGPVTLYAVWTLPDDYMATHIVTTALSVDKDEITYDTKESITLTAELTYSFDVMTSPTETFYFTQDGKDKVTNTTGKLTVKTVPDSGTYTYTYRIKDGEEPLWMYDGTSSDSQTITINKGIISVNKFTLTNEPYYGMALNNVTFTVTAKNSADVAVALDSYGWTSTLASNKVKEGTNTWSITLVPSDDVNYESTDLNVEFDSATLYITFAFPEVPDSIPAKVEYSQNYGPNEIIYLFTTVYLDALANNPKFDGIGDSGLAPYLADDDEIAAEPDYDGAPIVADSSGKKLYDRVHNNLIETFTIYVFFHEASYTVTFDPNSSSNTTTMPAPEEYGYGKFVKQPNDPTNGELLFVGWYFNEEYKDDNGNTQTRYRAWRFYSETDDDNNVIPQDRVTGNLTLTAEWLSANQLDSVDFTISPTAKFIAQGAIASGDLTVTGNYSGSRDGATAKASKVIPFGGYEIQYGTLDDQGEFVPSHQNFAVLDGGMYIRVGVKFLGATVYSAPQRIDVNPIDITEVTTKFNFGETDGVLVYEYDGAPKYVKTMSDSDVRTMSNGQIIGVEYEYRDAYTNQIVNDPQEIGTYTVTISYKTASANFYADPTIITMKIVSTIKVKVEWDTNSLMYTGAEQHPVVSKIYNAETGAEVAININDITYSGDTDAKNINTGSPYKVKVSLGDMYSIVEGEECQFNITKALLKIPTYTAGTIMYDGTTKVLQEYLGEQFNPLLMEIISGGTGREVDTYRATIKLTDTINCSWEDGTFVSKQIEWKIEPALLYVNWDKWEFVDDGVSAYAPKISSLIGLVGSDEFNFETDFIYKIYDEDGNLLGVSEVSDIGSYKITASFNGAVKNYTLDSTTKEWSFVVVPKSGMTILTIEWSDTSAVYDGEIHYPTPTIKDSNGNDVTEEMIGYLKFSDGYYTRRDIGTYSVKVTIKDSVADEYFIRSGATCKYKITDKNGNAPDEDETNANLNKDNDDNTGSGGLDMDSIMKVLREYWKAIVSGVCILLGIIFLAKAGGYNSRRKRAKKAVDDRYKAYYAGAIGLFGLASSTWTIIMSICIAFAVVSFIIMLICKKKCVKAEDELAYAKEDYARNQADVENRRREEEARQRDENMRMMFMNMFGGAAAQGMAQGMAGADGQAQGGYANMQPGIGMADIRGIVSETVTAMLPGVQQVLPAQATVNDELIGKLLERSEKSEEAMLKMMEKSQKNEEAMQNLLQKLAEQPAERVVEREVAASTFNEEAIQKLIDKNEERIGQMMKTQEALINKLLERDNTPQIVEKEVVKEVPVEKIVEKEVPVEVIKEVPVEVEKIVEKEVKVEVPVEKIVEKEVIKEVPVEVVKEVKVEVPVEVEKIVEVPVKAEPKPKKEVAPRLTLDEAYALLTKEQKKFFDGLKQYVLDKYKCKEKKTTYFVTYGQTSTNPLLKLMIKKNITVAMLKMEDELMKDIRRDATGDGTKVKVKETEILVTDAQAFETAKKMIDLRYDQIERYQDLLKEQRALRRK